MARGTVQRGVFVASAHGPAATVRYALAAERAGLDSVWLAEHHFIRYGQCPSATVLAGHLLAATSRVTIGTAACVLSHRHPVALGEEVAVLHALAPGRFRLGVARGGPWVDIEVFGTGPDRYRHGFAEALDLLRDWLSGRAAVGADGRYFRFREVAVVPRIDGPAMPTWVAATSPSTVDVAAARGLPLLLGVHDDRAAKTAMLDRYAQTAALHGHDPDGIPHASVHIGYPADSRAEAERALRGPLREWLDRTGDYIRVDGTPPVQGDLDSYVEHLLRIHPIGGHPIGAAGIEEWTAPGIQQVLWMVEAAGEPAAVEDLILALGQHAALTPQWSAES